MSWSINGRKIPFNKLKKNVVTHAKRCGGKMRFANMLCISFCLLLLFSCDKNKNPITPNIKKISQFPMEIGASWNYEFTDTTYYYHGDSMKIENGILHVKIIDSTILDTGKKAFIWQYEFQNNLDTLYSLYSGDSILFYPNKQTSEPKIIFLLPLTVSSEWEWTFCDKYKVLSKDTLNLPAGTFTNVFHVEQIYNCEIEAGLLNTYYINPGTGIVKYQSNYRNYHRGIKRNEKWVLKLCYIPD